MKEIWKDVPNYEGLYKVSNLGQVKSLLFCKEKILKPCENGKFDLVLNLRKDNKPTNWQVKHIVASAFLGYERGKRMTVGYIDEKNDNRLSNLFITKK
jgi:hypothetical protein